MMLNTENEQMIGHKYIHKTSVNRQVILYTYYTSEQNGVIWHSVVEFVVW